MIFVCHQSLRFHDDGAFTYNYDFLVSESIAVIHPLKDVCGITVNAFI